VTFGSATYSPPRDLKDLPRDTDRAGEGERTGAQFQAGEARIAEHGGIEDHHPGRVLLPRLAWKLKLVETGAGSSEIEVDTGRAQARRSVHQDSIPRPIARSRTSFS